MFIISKAKVPPGFPKIGREVTHTTLELEQTSVEETRKLIPKLRAKKPIAAFDMCEIHHCLRRACGCQKVSV